MLVVDCQSMIGERSRDCVISIIVINVIIIIVIMVERSQDCVIQISGPQELQLWRLWEKSKIGPVGSYLGNTYYCGSTTVGK